MHPELRPRDDLAEFLERAEPAGHRDKRIRQRRHRRLALVHRIDDAEIGQRAVRELPCHEGMWDYANRMAAGCKHGVSDHTHQADGAAAEDETDATTDHLASELRCRLGIALVIAGARSAKTQTRRSANAAVGLGSEGRPSVYSDGSERGLQQRLKNLRVAEVTDNPRSRSVALPDKRRCEVDAIGLRPLGILR